jgi:hypothetical protein
VSDYPVPRHAAYIWAAGDKLMVGLPPRSGELHGHTVALPYNQHGVAMLLRTLRERSEKPESFIGTKAEPTQYQLDKWLSAMAAQKREAAKAAVAAEIEEGLAALGL